MGRITIPQIVEKYMVEQGGNGKPMPLRDFAAALTEGIPELSISHQTVAYWLSGERAPGMDTVMTLVLRTRPDDWRHVLAMELWSLRFNVPSSVFVERKRKTGPLSTTKPLGKR